MTGLARLRAKLGLRADAGGDPGDPAGAESRDVWKRRLENGRIFLALVLRKSSDDGIAQRAAALAFVTILALVPLLAAFSFVAAQLLERYRGRVLDLLTGILPFSEDVLVDNIERFVEQAESLREIGFLTFILVGLAAFGAIEETINRIWQVSSRRSLRAKLVSFTLLVFWGPLVIGASYSFLLVLGQRPGFDVLFEESVLVQAVPLLVSLVGLTMLYWQVPFTRVRFSAALAGGATAAVLLEVLRRAFRLYVERMQVTYVVYGGFALAIFFMIAVQLAWWAVLLGTEIAYVKQHFRALTETRGQDARFREPWLGLAALATMLGGLREGRPLTDIDRLAAALGTAPEALRAALEPLVAGGLVMETTGEPAGFVLARDPHELTLEKALAVYERPVDELLAGLPEPLRENLETLMGRLRDTRATTLAGRSIVQLLG
jgi:membrane protein